MKKHLLLVISHAGMAFALAQPTQWISRGIGGGGALFAPSINPANPNEMYVGCDMSQLFHTTDRGLHWSEVPFGQLQGGHDSYICFTKNPSLSYGLHYLSSNGSDYIKAMKSTDGGKTWNPLAGDPFGGNPSAYVLRLFADYNNPSNLILADYSTIYFSSNGGNNFTKIHDNISAGSGNHIAGVFFDGSNIYIGTNDGLIYSTNSGASFKTMTVSGMGGSEYMLSFAGARKNGKVKFACLTSASVWAGYQYGSNYYNAVKNIYSMDDTSGTWATMNGGITFGTDFPVFVGMAANCTDTIYLAGGSSASAPIVMRSVGGGNWTHMFKSSGNQNIYTGWAGTAGDHFWSFPEAPFGFEVDQLDARKLMFSDFSCVHLTWDAGSTWYQRYLDSADENPKGATTPVGKKYHGIGLENTTNWQVMWADSLHLFAAFSDINGVTSDDKGMSWKFIPNLTQNSVYRILKHSDGNIYAATSNVHDMYQTTRIYDVQINNGKGGIWFSTNNGTSFSLLHDFAHPVVWIATDPSNPNRMYASVLHSNNVSIGGIWVTNNLNAGTGSTWTKMANPPRSNGHPYNINVLKNGDLVVSYSARKPTSGSQFTDSSGVYYYSVSQAKWFDRSHSNMKWYTKDVVVDTNDVTGKTWYACVFSGWGSAVPSGTGGLYKTTDTGKTWKQISNSYRVDGVSIMPGNSNILYFSTETDGLYYSSNATASTPTFSLVNSYPFRHPMRIFFNPWKNGEVWVSSFGSGMMVSSSSSTNGISQPNGLHGQKLMLYPNPSNGRFYVHFTSSPGTEMQQFELYDLCGKKVWSRQILLDGSIAQDLSVPSELKGIYILRCGEYSAQVVLY